MGRKRKDERQFWVLDAETDPFKNGRVPEPFIWGLYDGTSFYHFTTTDEMVAHIRDHDVIVYAHNGGKFDFHFLLERITLHERVTVINGRLVASHIGKCELRDSWNLLPISLADYQKDSIDYAIFEKEERDKPANRRAIIEYLKGDCIYLWELLDAFFNSYGRHLTQAGAAMAMWEEIDGAKAPQSTGDYYDRFSAYYYGGRVECFQSGRIMGPLSVFDITSAYPWAMLNAHPYGLEYVTSGPTAQIRPQSFVRLNCVSNGALPWRTDKGAMLFPCDPPGESREYAVCGHEYLAGLETGSISDVEILSVIDFVTSKSFQPYIDRFFKRRLEAKERGDKAQDIFCKLLMNSLYGKFAANPDNYGNFQCVPFVELEDYADEGYRFDGMIGPHALLKAGLDNWQKRYYNVATAASITSQVRAHLWRAICASDGIVYCDTDSIICRDNSSLDIGGHLGGWKLEGVADEAHIAGKKLYSLRGEFDKGVKEKTASKGVRLSARDIERVASGETVLHKNEAPTFRLRGAPVFLERNVKMTAKPSRRETSPV